MGGQGGNHGPVMRFCPTCDRDTRHVVDDWGAWPNHRRVCLRCRNRERRGAAQ